MEPDTGFESDSVQVTFASPESGWINRHPFIRLSSIFHRETKVLSEIPDSTAIMYFIETSFTDQNVTALVTRYSL